MYGRKTLELFQLQFVDRVKFIFGKVYNREDSEVLQRLSQRRRKAFCSRVKEIYRRQKSLTNNSLPPFYPI